jgi:hypothetical protein
LPEEFATLGKLGRTENEVAAHILVREAYVMDQRGFHEQRIRRRQQVRRHGIAYAASPSTAVGMWHFDELAAARTKSYIR